MLPIYTDTGQRPSDSMTTLRQFVGALNGALNDQTYAGYDGLVVNPTGQFATVGPNYTAVEGQPVVIASNGGVALSPNMVMLGVGALVAWFFLRKG